MRFLILAISLPGLLQAQTTLTFPAGVIGPVRAPVAAPTYKPEELCTVSGVVRHALSGEPVAKASVMLTLSDRPNLVPPPTTTTDAEGRFAMNQIGPGQYRLMAMRPGFVNSESFGLRPGVTITLAKAQSLSGLEIKLTPHSVVTGRITDEDGDPLPNASISLARPRYVQGKRQLVPIGGSAQSNDLGEYRIFGVAGGSYYASATANRGFNVGVDHSASRQADQAFPAATFYPGVTELQSATRINVPVGGTVNGIDVRLRKDRAYRVRGKVMGTTQTMRAGGMVTLFRKDGSGSMQAFAGAPNMARWGGASSEFELAGVRPGSYVVRAAYYDQDQQLQGVASLEVVDRDVDGLTVPMAPGLEAGGSIRADGDRAPEFDKIFVYLESRTASSMGTSSGRPKSDGTFLMTRVPPEYHEMRVTGVPPEYYVKSIRVGDRDVMENGLDLSGGAAVKGIEVLLSPAAAQVAGSVADEKGNPVKGAIVVVRPVGGRAWDLVAMTRPATSDQYGKFQIGGLAPGDYQLLAFSGLEVGDSQDPELFKEFGNKAETVKLGASSNETRQLKAVDITQR